MFVVEENVPLAPYTYFKIGGPARYFVEVTSEEELERAVVFAKKESIPVFILGSGSNILVSDKGFLGLVIKMNLQHINITEERVTAGLPAVTLVKAGAGVPMARVVHESVKNSLTGFEWAIGVPGSIGGSVRGNAGYAGIEMKNVVKDVTIFDTKKNTKYKIPARSAGRPCLPAGRQDTNCGFAYRHSAFKDHPEWIALSATLKLEKGDSKKSQELVKGYTRRRAETQEIGAQCAGSMFKNPDGSHAASSSLMRAGFLIDQAGLKGYKVGNVMVSPRHANFMVNTGGASAEEVIMLISIVKEYVHRTFGIFLEEEIQYVGF